MKTTNKQYGFHVVEAAIVILVLGLVGFTGYWVMHRSDSSKNKANTASVPAAPTIKTAKDLDTAAATVNKLDNSTDVQDLNNIEKDLDSL